MRTYARTVFAWLPLLGCWTLACLFAGAIERAGAIPLRVTPQDTPDLQLNQPINGDLKGGASHTYKLHLEGGVLARVVVMQQGVDVAVIALDARRIVLARVEDSFGRVGPQLLEFVTETAAEYFIEVRARPDESGGQYEIKYLGARAATATDRTRLTANRHITAGNGFRSRATAERQRAALAEYDQALTLFKQINDLAGQATALQYIGRIFETQSDYRKALENYTAALVLWRQVPDRRGEAYTTSNIGTMHLYLGDLKLADASFQQALEMYREVRNREGEGLCLQEIGNVHRQEGRLGPALEYFRQALNIFREVGAKLRMLYVLSNMGVAYQDLGDLKQGIDYQKQALAIGRELQQRHGTALAFLNLGDIYEQQGETRQALGFYQQALPLCLDISDYNCLGRTYRRLASVNDSLGETQAALDNYAKGAAIYRQRERPVELARLLNSAGRLYSSLGDKKRARILQTEALELSRKAQSRQDEAATLSNLAELYEDDGDQQKAGEYYRQSLAINREIQNRPGEAAALNRLGLLAHSAGHDQQARELFQRALAMNTEIGVRHNAALALNNLGVVHDGAGEVRVALDYFSRALAMFRQLENKNSEAMMLYRVASMQRKLGETEQARNNLRAALEIVETIRGKIVSADLRSSYFSTVQDYYDLYIDLLMREDHSRPGQGFDLAALQAGESARARSLLDLLREAKADLRHGIDAGVLTREKELLELINGKAAQQALAFSDPRKADLARTLGEEIVRLSDEYENLQVRIRQGNPRYADLVRAQPLTLSELQGLLDSQTVLLEYCLGKEHSYLWLVSPTRLQSVALPPRAQIEALAKQFYETLTERNRLVKGETPSQKRVRLRTAEENLQSVSQSLRQMILGPLAASLGAKRLVIVAEGALQYVPFAILLAPANAAVAQTADGSLAATEIITLPSIAVLAQLRRESTARPLPPKAVAVFADPVFEVDDPRLQRVLPPKKTQEPASNSLGQSLPDFDFGSGGRGLPRLIASREEARAIISQTANGTSYAALDFEANRERALSADLNQYRVLHFATHGLVNTARPELSGIVLSLYDDKGHERDGFLRLNQIYNLRLSSELVVLSACSTALGKDVKGEGLIGLTRGFMYAGASRIIASLWKVDDEATGELMKLFYRNLLRKQMSAAAALRAAQVEMQQQERWRSPYYWGAFVLQGDWR